MWRSVKDNTQPKTEVLIYYEAAQGDDINACISI